MAHLQALTGQAAPEVSACNQGEPVTVSASACLRAMISLEALECHTSALKPVLAFGTQQRRDAATATICAHAPGRGLVSRKANAPREFVVS